MAENRVEVLITAKDQASTIISKSTKNLEDSVKKAEKQTKASTDAMLDRWEVMAKRMAKRIIVTYVVYKTAAFIKDTALLAARFETLGIVMNQVGKTGGYSAEQMNTFDLALRKTGISMIESRQSLTKMVQAHLDLNKATELGRVAQDAAVIANINSSDAFGRLIYGIQSGQTEILRNMGIMVSFDQAYQKAAETLGKIKAELTESEKSTARMNAVLEKGKDIFGVYEAAMGTAGKQLTSFKRYVEDFEVKMGKAFGPATVILVNAATEAMKQMQDEISRPEAQEALKNISSDLAKIIVNLGTGLPGKIGAVVEKLEGLWKIISYDPAIIEFGLLGLAIQGRKGAVMGAMIGHMMTWMESLSKVLGLAAAGILKFSDVANANFPKLQQLLKEFESQDYLKILTGQTERLEEEIADLKELTEGRIFTFRGDKEALEEKQKQLNRINKIIADIKEKSLLAGLVTFKMPTPPKQPEVPAIPTISSEEIIKNMQLQEAFAIKMADEEHKRIDDRTKLQSETLEAFKIARMDETASAIYALDAQFLAYDSFVKDKTALDAWYVEEYNKIIEPAVQARFEREHEVMNALRESWGLTWDEIKNNAINVWADIGAAVSSVSQTTAGLFTDVVTGATTAREAAEQFLKAILRQTIQTLIQIGVQQLILAVTSKAVEATSTAVTIASMSAIAAAAAPAAMLVSIATVGAAPIAGAAAFTAAMGTMTATTMAARMAGTPGMEKGGIIYPSGDRRGVGIRVAERQAEAVVPLPDGRSIPVDMRGGGQGTANYFYIQAIDPKSFAEVVKRNPRAITQIISDDLNSYGPLSAEMRGALL